MAEFFSMYPAYCTTLVSITMINIGELVSLTNVNKCKLMLATSAALAKLVITFSVTKINTEVYLN